MHQNFQDTGILEALCDNYICLDIACVNSDLSDENYHEKHQWFAMYRRVICNITSIIDGGKVPVVLNFEGYMIGATHIAEDYGSHCIIIVYPYGFV
jgi:hypothetical protein